MTRRDLQQLQALPLSGKVSHTIDIVSSFMSRVSNGAVSASDFYVSFSGGADSLVLLDIVRRFIDPLFPAAFVNTGQEWPEVVRFATSFAAVDVLRPSMSVKQVVAKYGFPLVSHEVSRFVHDVKYSRSSSLLDVRKNSKFFSLPKKWAFLASAPFDVSCVCCDVLKKRPLKEYEKRTGRSPLIATMASESRLRTMAYLKREGCNAYTGHRASYPLSIWNREDVWQYIRETGIKYCPIYDRLPFKQTGCMFCGFGVCRNNGKLRALLDYNPSFYRHVLNFTNKGFTYRQALRYVGVSLPDEELF